MVDRAVIRNVIQRHEYAKTVCATLRATLSRLFELRELDGFLVAELPAPVDASIHGFDLSFADRRVRIILTGSTLPDWQVAMECWRVPIAYGRDLKDVAVLLVRRDGAFELPGVHDALYLDEAKDVHALICHLVQATTHPVGEC